MPTFSESFDFVYAVSKHDGQYSIADSHAVATGVTVSDDDSTLNRHDEFNVSGGHGHHHDDHSDHSSHSFHDGDYTFVERARTSSGEQGFIARDSHGQYFFFTDSNLSDDHSHHHELHEEHGGVTICFMAGTRIRTPAGETPIEQLAIGDIVATADGRSQPVRWIGRQTVMRQFADHLLLPVCVRAGAFADNVPSRDLLVSPGHAVLVEDLLVQAGSLVNGTSIVRQADVPKSFVYYHVEVDDHALVLAENTPAETFIDNIDRMRFDNWAEHEALFPAGRSLTELPYPRAKAARQVPRAIRERLAERGLALYGAPMVAAA